MQRCARELADPDIQAELDALAAHARRGRVTLLFAAHDPALSNAAVLTQILDRRGAV